MEPIVHIQGSTTSPLTPLFLVHAVSGLALPYFALGNLSADDDEQEKSRPVYGISSPLYSSRTYRTPNSLDEIARQYVAAIQREVQPVGPYLLGGWSMGGMIAVKMADILQSQGEKALHVIMIDSVNPEHYPSFIDEAEHEAVADLVYSGVAKKMNLPDLSSESDGILTDAEDEEEDEDVQLDALLLKMRKHIWDSTRLISRTEPGQLLAGRCNTAVTLIKCTSLAPTVPALRLERKVFIRKCFLHPHLRWKARQFNRFRTILFNAQHDDVFDPQHVDALTVILRNILENV
ncbi:hypothetical protein VTN02DRAFT_1119 [Thermoascus thermophilus]